MALEHDQIRWRTVFCGDPSLFHVTTYPFATGEHTVVQPDKTKLRCTTTPDATASQKVVQATAANLKCTNTPDGTTTQPVVQADPANLKMTNSPDGENPQMVTQYTGVKGIWPVGDAERVNASAVQSGVNVTNVYTVPASKKLYIASASLVASETADAVTQCWMGVRDNGDNFKFWMIVLYFTITGSQVMPQRYVPAIELDAAWDVFVKADHANLVCRGLIHGWLEDV